MQYIEREGTQDERPTDFDGVSSKDTIYFRRGQRQIEEKQEDGTVVKKWKYEEAEVDRETWEREQRELRSPALRAIMQANNELIAKNELLQIEVESLMDYVFLEKAGE